MIELLEARLQFNGGTLTAERFGDALVVTGTAGNDVISVRQLDPVTLGLTVPTATGEQTVYRTPLNKVRLIAINGGAGSDEVRVDLTFHVMTHARSVESCRVYYKGGSRLTGEYSTAPLPGRLDGSVQAWIDKHQRQLNALTASDKKAEILFIGDSMAERFVTTGMSSWNRLILPRKAVNLGLSGDTTSNLLYRIANGLFDGFAPRVVVLSIGTNNIDRTDDANSASRGIAAVTRAIGARLPDSKVLIASLFPRRKEFEINRVQAINARIAGWDNGANLRVLDLTRNFAADPVREDLFWPNDIHLNVKGYRLWANLLVPVLDEMVG